jgi:hypothetical protein
MVNMWVTGGGNSLYTKYTIFLMTNILLKNYPSRFILTKKEQAESEINKNLKKKILKPFFFT